MVTHVEINISTVLSEEEWKRLRAFCDKARRLIATKLVSGNTSSIHGNIRYAQDKGLWFEAILPPDKRAVFGEFREVHASRCHL
jgi:hypothetical protein